MNKIKVLEILRNNAEFLQKEYFVKRIGLFGSYAKDENTFNSDIDLVVEFEKPLGFKFVLLADYLEELLNHKVDLLTPDGISSIRSESIKNSITNTIIYA